MLTLLSVVTALLAAGPRPAPPARPVAAADSTIAAATYALAHGQPWRASRLLAPLLRDSVAGREPATVLLAAEAAAAWGGWTEVQQLLASARWVDSVAGGRGRELLARAALDRQADSEAVRHARLAITRAKSPQARAVRLVLLARALDRLEQRDSASAAYRAAAAGLPAIADWLAFRAVSITDDSVARAALADGITSPVVRDRLPLAEAQARERAGDLLGAAARYAALGSWTDAYRLRFAAATRDSSRGALRTELVSVVTSRPASAEARAATLTLSNFAPLAPAEELAVGRSAAVNGAAARTAASLGRALKAGLGTDHDHFAYGSALFDLRRYSEAAFELNLVRTPAALAASAAYARGRALVRGGQVSEGRSALRELLRKYPAAVEPCASALLLLADLAADERRDTDARAALLQLAARYPSSLHAAPARFRAAIIAIAALDFPSATRELDTLVRRYPQSGEALAARFWAARALASAGDTAGARARWEDVAGRDPLSYYSAAAARRLGRAPWTPAAAPDSFVAMPDVDSALARAAQLDSLGMGREARWEQDRAARIADGSAERVLAAAAAFRRYGLVSRAVQAGWRAVALGAPRDARTFRLLFPLHARAALEASAREQRIDPTFVAALIRQESIFTPGATSPAGARGLMQLMPPVGKALATAAKFPLWDPVLLYQPDVNIELGTRHLAELMRRYPEPVRALAAYNAGTTRVELWSSKTGMDDQELFAERIPYRETRDYVRIIQRNQDMYRALYGLADAGAGGAPAGGR